MPGSLDSCINSIYEPGNIPASAGTPPVRVLLKDAIEATISEAATADAIQSAITGLYGTVLEAAAAAATQDGTLAAVAMQCAMLPGVFINSNTPRQAMANDVMVNL